MAELMEILKALSDESRLKLVELLLRQDYCVGALAKHLSISESAVSQHLKVLRMAGIVKGEKRGYFTHYWVDRDLISTVADQLKKIAQIVPDEKKCQKSTSHQHQCCRKEEMDHE